MNTLRTLMRGMPPQFGQGAPFGATQLGQGVGPARMPQQPAGPPLGAVRGLPALPGAAGAPMAPQMPGGGLPVFPGGLPGAPPMAGQSQPLEIRHGQGISAEDRERLGSVDPGYAQLMFWAAQRIGRMPKNIIEVADTLSPLPGDE